MNRFGARRLVVTAIALTLGAPELASALAEPTAGQGVPLEETYKLGPGDKVKISVFGEPDMTGEFAVTDGGGISYPIFGGVDVRNFTATELQKNLETRLANGYVKNPRVSVEIVKYRPYYVYGEVTRPGEYPFDLRITLQQAVAAAGGYSYRASRTRVYLQHAGEAHEERVDLKSDLTTLVRPGDTIRVGERHF